MAQFALAYSLFMAAHAVPAVRHLRGFALQVLGRRLYLATYSLVAVLLLVWLIMAAGRAPSLPLWPATPELALVPLVVMPFALVLIVGGLIQPNPLSVSWRSEAFDPELPGVVAVTRHPVLWGFLL